VTIDDLAALDDYAPWSPLAVDCLLYSDNLSAVILPMVVAAEDLEAIRRTISVVLSHRQRNLPGS
jgi:hypothetical protein